MKEPSESSNTSMKVNSQNNYKYDQYGFVLVNTIEDLLYDKFNNNMENDFNNIIDKKSKKYNGNCNNLMRNCKSIDNNKKARKHTDKSMRLVLKINNKDKKAFRIYPNDSRSIESITLKEKESDLKNSFNKGSNNKKKDLKRYHKKGENKKNSKKKTKRKYDNNNYENNDEFTFCEEENEEDSYNNAKRKKIKIKKKTRKKEIDSQEEDEEEDEEEEDDEEEEESDTDNLNRKKKLGILSRPILSQCIMTKTRMNEPDINQIIPKTNRTFFTKTYDSNKKKNRTKILTWPNSTLCYFYKNNQIIHMNIQIPLQNVINKNYFCTKQITNTKDKKLLPKTPVSPNVVIKIINPENSPYKYGKINIKARSGKNSNPIQKTYLFKIRENKTNKNILSDKLSKSNCFRNVEIIKALNKKTKKSKSKKKKEIISPECIALKRRKKFGDKIYKKIMKKNVSVYPPEYRISIKTKFRNNILNNKKRLELKKEEEKLVKNNSMIAHNNLKTNKNVENIKYPAIRKMVLDENTKNKVPSLTREPKFNFNFQTLGRYNPNNNSQNFPAINSYFH